MKYKKIGNVIYILFFIFSIFITINYKDTIELPMSGEQRINRERIEEYFNAEITDEEFKATEITRFVNLFIWLTHVSLIVLQDESINTIKRFFKSRKNKIFAILNYAVFLILRFLIYNLDYYKLPMVLVNSLGTSILMFYFINSKEVNEINIRKS